MADEKRFLNSMPWFLQFLILMGLVAVVIFATDFFLISATRAEAKENLAKLEQLKRENDANQIVLGNMQAFEKSLNDSKAELEQLKGLLPESVELSDIMKTIEDKAIKHKLVLRVFHPHDSIARDYYTEKPITLDVVGGYNDLGEFLADLANYERINNVSNFHVVQTEVQTEKVSVSSTFNLTIYYVSQDNLNNLKNKGQVKKAEPGKDEKK